MSHLIGWPTYAQLLIGWTLLLLTLKNSATRSERDNLRGGLILRDGY